MWPRFASSRLSEPAGVLQAFTVLMLRLDEAGDDRLFHLMRDVIAELHDVFILYPITADAVHFGADRRDDRDLRRRDTLRLVPEGDREAVEKAERPELVERRGFREVIAMSVRRDHKARQALVGCLLCNRLPCVNAAGEHESRDDREYANQFLHYLPLQDRLLVERTALFIIA